MNPETNGTLDWIIFPNEVLEKRSLKTGTIGKWVPLKIKMDLLSTKSLERTNIIIVCYLFLLFGVRS